jgi:hypothetical protein
MPSQFAPSTPSDLPQIAAFLRSNFNEAEGVSSFDQQLLQWKYFDSYPGWAQPRSFLLRQDQQITSHGGVWPVVLQNFSTTLRAGHLIDWAASPSHPGGGVAVLRKIASTADLLLTIGGSLHTRTILPRLGYRNCGEMPLLARVVRPWLQWRTHPSPDHKAPLRFVRNTLWNLAPWPAVPKSWEAVRIAQFESGIQLFLDATLPQDFTSSRRTWQQLNYLLQCPAATFSAFLIAESGQLRGYFVVSQMGKQARIVEMRLSTTDESSRHIAASLAGRTASRDPQVCEVVSGSSWPPGNRAFERAGFRVRRRQPIFCLDPANHLRSAPPLNLTMLDGDLCFFSDPSHPYLT